MLTVAQLIEYTRVHSPMVLKKANSVSVRITSVREDEDEQGDKYKLVKSTCVADTSPRYVVMQIYGDGPKAHIWASCTCEWWLYHCEVAVERKGSTGVIHSNGELPKVTNPRMIPSICKHIAASLLKGALKVKPTTERKAQLPKLSKSF